MEPLLTTDAEELAELEALLFPDISLNEHSLSLEIAAGRGWAIRKGSKIVAYLFGRSEGATFDILRLGVVEEYRGQGLGTQLLQRALVDTPDAMLSVRKENRPALHLYLKHGFRIVGELSASGFRWSPTTWAMRRVTA